MSLRPYKFQVVAVTQSLDEDGNVVGEAATHPVEIFGCDQLAKWANEFTANLATVDQPTA